MPRVSMPRVLLLLLLLGSVLSLEVDAQHPGEGELRRLLNDFLAGVSRGEPQAHERFWADDLVYTSSAGTRTGKAAILDSARRERSSESTARVSRDAVIYSAEYVDIRLYDDMAVVAFRLVATPEAESPDPAMQYLNTGTFLKRDGEWRAVAWQATAIPED